MLKLSEEELLWVPGHRDGVDISAFRVLCLKATSLNSFGVKYPFKNVMEAKDPASRKKHIYIFASNPRVFGDPICGLLTKLCYWMFPSGSEPQKLRRLRVWPMSG